MIDGEFEKDSGDALQPIPLETSKGDDLANVLSRALHAGPHLPLLACSGHGISRTLQLS